MKETLAVASLALSLASNVPYIGGILQGKVRPERVSWLLWTLLGGTYYFSALLSGGATFFTFGELIGPAIIFVLSLKFGVGGRSRFDLVALSIAMVAFSLLFVFDNVLVGLILALIVDIIGGLLTVRKLRIDPSSESRIAWALSAFAAVLAIAALDTLTLETVLFPLYILTLSSFIFAKTTAVKTRKKLQLDRL